MGDLAGDIIDLDLNILIAEDSKFFTYKIIKSLTEYLPKANITRVHELNHIDKVLEMENFHVLVLDLIFPSGSSLPKIVELKRKYPSMYIIISSGQSDVRTALTAINDGADHYVVKDDGFSSDLLLALHNISKSLEREEKMQFMADQIFDKDKYPMILLKASETGVSEVFRDFEEFPEPIENKDFITQIGLSIMVAIGQGDQYHTGVFQFPAVESKFYTILDFAFRLPDSTAIDQRLTIGYFHLVIFIPDSFLSMFPPSNELSYIIDLIKIQITDADEITEEKMDTIKNQIFQTLKLHMMNTKLREGDIATP